MPILSAFATDLARSRTDLLELATELDEIGYRLTELRVLELLIWIATEPVGYYRDR